MCLLCFENNLLTSEGVRFASISKKTPLSKLSFAFVSLALPFLHHGVDSFLLLVVADVGPQHDLLDVVIQLLQAISSAVVSLKSRHSHIEQILKNGGGLGHYQLSSSSIDRRTDPKVNLSFITIG
jgi:hypothetical protein